jgi:hypothetical protein
MFCPAFTETHSNFRLVARALDFDNNTFTKDCMLDIVSDLEIDKMICIARL